MKKSLMSKLLAAAAAMVMVLSLTACSNQNTTVDETPDSPVSVSDTTVSGGDVSASDVSGSDVVVVDDETASNSALEAYFAALNSGNVDKLVELTAAPPMMDFLSGIGLDADYLRSSFQTVIDSMKAVSGDYRIDYTYTVIDADEAAQAALAAELDALSEGAGQKVQAVRVYSVDMVAYAVPAVVSGTDVSASDAAEALEQSSSTLRLYKYDGVWYVFGE